MLNEKRMRMLLSTLGSSDATLVAFNNDRTEQVRLQDDILSEAMEVLEHVQELISVVERRGLTFAQLLAQRANDPEGQNRLPRIHLLAPSAKGVAADHFFWSEQQEDDFRQEHGLSETDPDMDKVIGESDDPDDAPRATRKELHEVKELERPGSNVSRSWACRSTTTASRKPRTSPACAARPASSCTPRTARANPSSSPWSNLNGVIHAILAHGKRGMDIKRLQGPGRNGRRAALGDHDEPPPTAVLLRVTWDAASEAEQLFSVPDGRRGRAAPQIHRGPRPGREEPGRVSR